MDLANNMADNNMADDNMADKMTTWLTTTWLTDNNMALANPKHEPTLLASKPPNRQNSVICIFLPASQWRTFLLHPKPLKRQNNVICRILPAEATQRRTFLLHPKPPNWQSSVICIPACRSNTVAHFPASPQTTEKAKQCHMHTLACRGNRQWRTFHDVICIFLPAEARSSDPLSCFTLIH
jgi:hypothetical protein